MCTGRQRSDALVIGRAAGRGSIVWWSCVGLPGCRGPCGRERRGPLRGAAPSKAAAPRVSLSYARRVPRARTAPGPSAQALPRASGMPPTPPRRLLLAGQKGGTRIQSGGERDRRRRPPPFIDTPSGCGAASRGPGDAGRLVAPRRVRDAIGTGRPGAAAWGGRPAQRAASFTRRRAEAPGVPAPRRHVANAATPGDGPQFSRACSMASKPACKSTIRSSGSSSPTCTRTSGPPVHGRALRRCSMRAGMIRLSKPPHE